MGADQALKIDYPVQSDSEIRETIQYEPFGLLGRKVSVRDRVKKGIFLFSAAAAVGYYVFLIVLFLFR